MGKRVIKEMLVDEDAYHAASNGDTIMAIVNKDLERTPMKVVPQNRTEVPEEKTNKCGIQVKA